MTFKPPFAAFSAALLASALIVPAPTLPSSALYAQASNAESNAESKAKRKGGYREGRSPTELAAVEEASEAADAAASFPPVVQDYEPNPAIWKLSDEDTTIYLFGTFHILPKGFKWRSDAFNAIVKQADELVVESVDDEEDTDLSSLMLIGTMFGSDRVPISKQLSGGAREKWFKLADLLGEPRTMFDRMPLFLSLMGAGASFLEDTGSLSEYGVETILEAEFAEAGKPIGAIEDGDAVMASLINLEGPELIAELEKDLNNWDGESLDSLMMIDPDTDEGNDEDPLASEHKWAQGISDEMNPKSFGPSAVGKEIYRILLTDRNRTWAQWLDKRLEQPGTILVAVGAGHFEGPDSVQTMLAERNLTVERLN